MNHDLRFALRSFARQPGFFIVAVLTLALGVGLTTTIFSVADNLMFRPLPYPEAERLFSLAGAARAEGSFRIATAAGDHRVWRETGAFSSIATMGSRGLVSFATHAETRRVPAGWVDEAFLATLGVQPLLGRAISADDCRQGAAPVAVIAFGLWQRSFGGDRGALDRTIAIGGRPARIVGILPRDFLFPQWSAFTSETVEILLPLAVPPEERFDHNRRVYMAIGRLSPEATVADAQARLDAAQQSVGPLYSAPRNVRPGPFDGVTMTPLLESLTSPAARGAVVFLFVAAFLVLAVAAVNVANMLLARGADRARELAVRAAIGASRGRLARLLLVESVALGMAGGALGLLTARLTFGLVLTQLPTRLVGFRQPEIDLRVALFAWGLALAVGILFGLLPALRLSRPHLVQAVKEGAPALTRGGGWTRDALIFVEIALAVMLVGGGALVLRSFVNLVRVDTGMDPRGVLTMQVSVPARAARPDAEDRSAFFRRVLDAVEAAQGVHAAALTDSLLMSGMSRGSSLSLADLDHKRLYTRGNWVSEVHVSAGYFKVVGVPIVRGQSFPANVRGRDAVAIVAERMGRFAGVDPIGRELVSLQDSTRRYRVIGVVAESRERGLEADPMSTVYLPLTGNEASLLLLLRADQPLAVATTVRDAIRRVDPDATVDQVRTLQDLAYRSIAERRFNAFLYGAFSISALALSMIGIYGVIGYTVARRTREIGIRIALGATPSRVVTFVTRRLAAVLVLGVAAGLAGLAALQTALRSLLFQLQPNDPATLGPALALMGIAAFIAAYVPARRATRVDPMTALRAE